MSGRAPILPTLATIAVALIVAAVAFASWHPGAGGRTARLELASRHLRFAQTRPNQALIKLPNAKPGQLAKGSTRLSVTGASAAVTVGVTNLRDVAGPRGGRLVTSGKLRIAVSCTGHPCPGTGVAYMGPLSQMHTRSLGLWSAGTRRTYTIRVWMANGGPALDNAFQGSSARFGLVWTAVQT